MSKEYEAKYLEVDENLVKEKLREIGATQVHEPLFIRRTVFFLKDKTQKGFVRVRDEGDKITVTKKTYDETNYAFEEEEDILDYNEGIEKLKEEGYEQKAYQESYREKWSHPLALEITFDKMPGLPLYSELECESEELLNQLVDLLELDRSKMRFGGFDKTYEEYYGIPRHVLNDETRSLTFENIINEITPLKNMELLEKVYNADLLQYVNKC
jgi:adenylate cyclase class 2